MASHVVLLLLVDWQGLEEARGTNLLLGQFIEKETVLYTTGSPAFCALGHILKATFL